MDKRLLSNEDVFALMAEKSLNLPGGVCLLFIYCIFIRNILVLLLARAMSE